MVKTLAVLIVEDLESDAQLIVRLLTKAGYAIMFEQVETAAQMRAALERQTWEIVISDYSLPEINGQAALKLLQEIGQDIPFIVVSGAMGEETAVAMMKAGAHDYVMKDNLARLAPAVERELIQAEVRRERKQAEEALRTSEERFKTIFIQAPMGITLSGSLTGHIYEVNPRFAEIVGRSMEEMTKVDWMQITHPNDVQADLDNMALMNAGKINGFQMEKRFLHPDGTAVWTNMTIAPLEVEDKAHPRHLCMIEDITERKQAEEKIRAMNAELEQRVDERTRELRDAQEQLVRQEKLALLGQLAGGVGHELRNPLGVISNAVYYLRLVQPDADEKVNEYLGIIANETNTAEKIITDLLDFSRIKSVDREAIALADLVRLVLERFPPSEDIKVEQKLPEDLPIVYADPRQMAQVLGNLVVNACQAMQNGGTLILSARIKKKEVAIAVKDTGTGIAPENMKKLFEPLFTTKAKGIGLGLAVSKKLAEANEGRIEVVSEPGKGSTFIVYLPVSREME